MYVDEYMRMMWLDDGMTKKNYFGNVVEEEKSNIYTNMHICM